MPSILVERRGVCAAVLLLSACSSPKAEKAVEPPPPTCVSASFEGTPLTHCTAVPGRNRITTALAGPTGKPYRSLTELAASRPSGAPRVAFAMNAGMFDNDGQPIGYFVQAGKRFHTLNTREGWGNFHLMPNGVFYGRANGPWAVRTTQSFASSITRRPDFGTQSGPMLVIDGKLHPKIDPDGASLKLRNAVGVDRQGRAHFVIADAPISFGRLARYFRDVLHCPNALFLDGSVSSLWDPDHGRADGGPPLGPLIVIEKRDKAGEAKDPT